MEIVDARVLPVDFPLQHTFRTTAGQKSVTRNILFHIRGRRDIEGYGEASSSLAMPEATQESMFNVLQALARFARGKSSERWETLALEARRMFPGHPTAVSAFECALLDAHCRAKKIPLWRRFGQRPVEIETFYTLPASDRAECQSILDDRSIEGFRKFKVKVTGRDAREDFQRVWMVAECMPEAQIIVDANQAWKPDEAMRFIDRIFRPGLRIELIEQPVARADFKGMAFVRRRSPIPVAADESLRSLDDARRLVELGAADVFNLKLAKLGLLESFAIADYLKAQGKTLMIGCMMESEIGLCASLHWAAGSGDFRYVDLDSFLLLKPLPVLSALTVDGPRLWVSNTVPGTGVTWEQLQ